MSDHVIIADRLSKRYRLGEIGRQTLKDEFIYLWHKALGRNPLEHMGKVGVAPQTDSTRLSQDKNNDFWALRDISFKIDRGEVLGIIGRNGSGKSTLLKLLSRITEPTSGEAFIEGRVGSLLEVGTGFHPELTGRENVFMNGTILGMKRREIEAKFDEIVAFSGLEKFIDTPVKRYSSGMYVRLAFAVAAHLEPEILFIDEVLAVGDAAFQKQCLGKMGDVVKEGRTILFVSHNMAAIENLCTRSLWLENGQVRMIGETGTIVDQYLGDIQVTAKNVSIKDRTDRRGTGRAKLIDFYVLNEEGKRQNVLRPGNTYCFHLVCELSAAERGLSQVSAGISLSDSRNETIWVVNSNFTDETKNLPPGVTHIECTVHDFNVAEGTYSANLSLGQGTTELLDFVTNAVEITIEGGDFFGTGSKGAPSLCKTLTRATWKTSV